MLLLIGVITLATRGLNLGIDFTGGTIWKTDAGAATVAEVQDAMAELGYDDVQVQEVSQVSGGDEVRRINVEAEASAEPSRATTEALDAARVRSRRRAGRRAQASPVGRLDQVLRATCTELDGPFPTDVPEELAALQIELDGLPGG